MAVRNNVELKVTVAGTGNAAAHVSATTKEMEKLSKAAGQVSRTAKGLGGAFQVFGSSAVSSLGRVQGVVGNIGGVLSSLTSPLGIATLAVGALAAAFGDFETASERANRKVIEGLDKVAKAARAARDGLSKVAAGTLEQADMTKFQLAVTLAKASGDPFEIARAEGNKAVAEADQRHIDTLKKLDSAMDDRVRTLRVIEEAEERLGEFARNRDYRKRNGRSVTLDAFLGEAVAETEVKTTWAVAREKLKGIDIAIETLTTTSQEYEVLANMARNAAAASERKALEPPDAPQKPPAPRGATRDLEGPQLALAARERAREQAAAIIDDYVKARDEMLERIREASGRLASGGMTPEQIRETGRRLDLLRGQLLQLATPSREDIDKSLGGVRDQLSKEGAYTRARTQGTETGIGRGIDDAMRVLGGDDRARASIDKLATDWQTLAEVQERHDISAAVDRFTDSFAAATPVLGEFSGALSVVSQAWAQYADGQIESGQATMSSVGAILKAGAASIKDIRARSAVMASWEIAESVAAGARFDYSAAAGHAAAAVAYGAVAVGGTRSTSSGAQRGTVEPRAQERVVPVTVNYYGYYGQGSPQENAAALSGALSRARGSGFERAG